MPFEKSDTPLAQPLCQHFKLFFCSLLGLPVLKIKGLQEVNEVAHHTEKYETAGLFLRRGQTFKIEIDLKRAVRDDEEQFHIKLETGKYPKRRNGTMVVAEKVDEFVKVGCPLNKGKITSKISHTLVL